VPADSATPINVSFESALSRPPSLIFTPLNQESSHDTSLVDEEDPPKTQYNLNQDFNDIFKEPSFVKSLNAVEGTTGATKIVRELVGSGPCREPVKFEEIPHHVSFLIRYECHRIARKASMSPRQFFIESTRRCKTETPAHPAFWDAAKDICKRASPTHTLLSSDKSSIAAWDSAKDNFTTNSDKSIMLSGALAWSSSSHEGLFNLELKPLQLEKSCRFERRFGGDRLLCLTIPDLARDIPQHLKLGPEDVLFAVSQWLGCYPLHIAGRQWRAFYIENVDRKRNSAALAGFKVFLFAVNGVDFSSKVPTNSRLGGSSSDSRMGISLESFIDWYMPIKANIGSKDQKFFQRLKLGLSRSYSTIVLNQDEFVDLQDRESWKTTMNDGCARISRKLAKAVSDQLGLDRTPSVFQGRISGAKGLWMVEDDVNLYPDASKQRGFWIEVTTSSQLKVLPHPKDRPADAEHRTFEVLAWSKSLKIAVLTKQLIAILHHGGVKKELLESRLRANTHGYYTDLLEAKQDPRLLRAWTQQHKNTVRDKTITMLGSLPNDRAEQINFLLESGFSADDNEVIVSRIRRCLTGYLDEYVDRLHLRIDMSTTAWCVPDPYGILEDGEIQLNFSEPWVCSNGQPLMTLSGRNCLVYRSPAYLPSDAQRVRGVFRPELEHLQNVAIFSTKGRTPLASKLSGGDYDGDKVWVCFDQELVDSFKNTPVALKPPTEAECGLINISRRLIEIFTTSETKASEIDGFLTECFHFNLQTPMLGQCSNQHEMVAYHKPRGLAEPGALTLAALVGYLVDAPKQGYALTEQAWNTIRNKTSGRNQLTRPAYKDSDATKGNPKNIVDYLKFVVATDEKNQILTRFHKDWSEGPLYDMTLSAPYNNAVTVYKTNGSEKDKVEKADKQAGWNIIEKLKKDIDAIKLRFSADLARYRDDDQKFEDVVWEMFQQLQSVEPLRDADHELCRRFDYERGEQFSNWSRLRASCFYYRWAKGVSPWYTAGTDLARIKAESKGPISFMTGSMHQIMKPDGKLVTRVAQRAKEDEEYLSFEQLDD
jgi:hypothetical protein